MEDYLGNLLVAIPALPLLGAILAAVLGPRVLRGQSHIPVVAALALACVCSLLLTSEINQRQSGETAGGGFERVYCLWTWASIDNAYDQHPAPPSSADAGAIAGGMRDFRVEIVLRADALTAMMLSMVTFISTLVAVFAVGYMHDDRGYWRFFAYIGLFVFSMTMLVSVSNFVLLFVFWEAVGVCSYLLIGFWYTKPEAAAAGKKAFLVNRIGDFGFTLAILLIWTTYGTLNFHDESAVADNSAAADQVAAADVNPAPSGVLGKERIAANAYRQDGVGLAICLLLLLGACGKSAQFPLHVWLPDAMEGPTPVSALIHAATMVTAGVYMVARCTPLFMAAPAAQLVVAAIGAFTALLAGLIALTQFDLKRVLAYSTISQLGYMFLGLGVGTFAGISSGMFHLFTHAFFKALLFLGAGSVMHAMGNVIDMRRFGGLRKIMPHTHATFLIGCLALAGVWPLSGFWSKDSILGAVHDRVHEMRHELDSRHGAHEEAGHATASAAHANLLADWSDGDLARFSTIYNWLYYASLATALLTAFYTFRAFYMTFYGDERVPPEAHGHAHESPPIMWAPLAVLAVCAFLVGLVFDVTWWSSAPTHRFAEFLAQTPSLAAGMVAETKTPYVFHAEVAAISTIVALIGIGAATFFYLGDRREIAQVKVLFDLEGLARWTNGEWAGRLLQIGWVAAIERAARQVYLGWLVDLIVYVIALVLLIVSIPLVLGYYLSPYKLSLNKFYFDEIYNGIFVAPLRLLATLSYAIDRWVIDRFVNFCASIPPRIGSLMRSLQMGLVQFYALGMVLGALVILAVKMLLTNGE